MNKKIYEITTKDKARQYAIDWQNWQAEQIMSWGELYEWEQIFISLAKRFNLTEEFKANSII